MTSQIFQDQQGQNILAYVDDIVIKSKRVEGHVSDLVETFSNIRKAGLKVNPNKCVFGIKQGKILGCLISSKGIKGNPANIHAVINMRPPETRKHVQKLVVRLATLNRFISRSAGRSLSFFCKLRSSNPFTWGLEQQKAFDDLKDYLTTLTTTSSPTALHCGF